MMLVSVTDTERKHGPETSDYQICSAGNEAPIDEA